MCVSIVCDGVMIMMIACDEIHPERTEQFRCIDRLAQWGLVSAGPLSDPSVMRATMLYQTIHLFRP